MSGSTELQQLLPTGDTSLETIPANDTDESIDYANIKIENKPSYCNFYSILSILSLLTFFCFLGTCKLYIMGNKYNEQFTCISDTFSDQNTTTCVTLVTPLNNCTIDITSYQDMSNQLNHYPIGFLSSGFIMLGLFAMLIFVACTKVNYKFKYGYLSSTIIMILTLIFINLSMFNNLAQNSQIITNGANDCYVLESDIFDQIINLGHLPMAYIFGTIPSIYITCLLVCNIELVLNICKKKVVYFKQTTVDNKVIEIITWVLIWGASFLIILGVIETIIFLAATTIVWVGLPMPSVLTMLCFGSAIVFGVLVWICGYAAQHIWVKGYVEAFVPIPNV